MAIVTEVHQFDLTIRYFDGIPFEGFDVEGMTPHFFDDPGWVCFQIQPTYPKTDPDSYFRTLRELAEKLFCDLGFTAEQVIQLTEDF